MLSRLDSNSWAQAILSPQPTKWLGYRCAPPQPDFLVIFKLDKTVDDSALPSLKTLLTSKQSSGFCLSWGIEGRSLTLSSSNVGTQTSLRALTMDSDLSMSLGATHNQITS